MHRIARGAIRRGKNCLSNILKVRFAPLYISFYLSARLIRAIKRTNSVDLLVFVLNLLQELFAVFTSQKPNLVFPLKCLTYVKRSTYMMKADIYYYLSSLAGSSNKNLTATILLFRCIAMKRRTMFLKI